MKIAIYILLLQFMFIASVFAQEQSNERYKIYPWNNSMVILLDTWTGESWKSFINKEEFGWTRMVFNQSGSGYPGMIAITPENARIQLANIFDTLSKERERKEKIAKELELLSNDALIEILNDTEKDRTTIVTAIMELTKRKEPLVIPWLIAHLGDDDIKDECAKALVLLLPVNFGTNQSEWETWWNARGRQKFNTSPAE